MNIFMPSLFLLLTFVHAPLSWANHYTLDLLQAVVTSETVIKLVKKQEQEGFNVRAIQLLDAKRSPGCEKFSITFNTDLSDSDAENSERKLIITTQLKIKKGKIKVVVEREENSKE